MQIIETPIQGLLEIQPKVFGDKRGFFLETWQKKRYEEAGIHYQFVQDNRSFSSRGTLRGLHFQKRFPQGKLVSVIFGEVFDVAVDLWELVRPCLKRRKMQSTMDSARICTRILCSFRNSLLRIQMH